MEKQIEPLQRQWSADMQKQIGVTSKLEQRFAGQHSVGGENAGDHLFEINTENLTKLRILIIDDNPIISEGLRVCLEADERTWLVDISNSERANILAKIEMSPKIILIGANLSVEAVLKILESVYSKDNFPKTIIMCERADEYHQISKLLPACVMGIIEYYSDIQIYKSAIKAISSGNRFYSPSILKLMFPAKNKSKLVDTTYNLTNREMEILKHISEGMSSKEIARHYELSVRTVETHRQNIRQKTKVKGLRELIQIAKGLGLDKKI